MATKLHKAGESAASALIRRGDYDTASAWSFSAEDGDKLLGADKDDWAEYGKWHLGEDDAEPDDTKAHWKYPYGKDGKVYRRALAAIRSRASQQDATAVYDAAGTLMEEMDKKEEKKQKEAKETEEREDPEDGEDGASQEDGDESEDERRAFAAVQRGLERIERKAGAGLQLRQVMGVMRMEPETLNAVDRTVDMSVSSGAAVRRYDYEAGREYDEVLAIAPAAIRLDRLNRGAPMLDSHQYWQGTRAMIGTVVPGSARIEDGELRAQAKFASTPEGERCFQMAREGVLRHVSVGYVTHREEIDEGTSPPTYRATDWEPYEVSAVHMPADPRAGFRAFSPRSSTPAGRTTIMAAEVAAAADAAVKKERERVSEIKQIGARLKLPSEFVKKHEDDGTSVAKFRELALDSLVETAGGAFDGNGRGTIPAPALTGRYKARELNKKQQIGRLVRLYMAGKGDPTRVERLARAPEWDDGNRDWQTRALTAGIGASGGFLIPEEYFPEVIELLRNRAVVRKLGALQIPMEGGNLTMPRLQGGASATYVGEATANNASQEQFGQVRFTEKKLMTLVPVSNDLLKFASPQADEVVLTDMIAQMAVAEDAAFIRGTGTVYSPKGMRNWAPPVTNVLTSAGATLANFVTDLEAMETALESQNVRMINPGIIFNPRSKNTIKLFQTTTGAFVFRDEMAQGMLDGYRFEFTNNIPANLGGGSQTEWYLADFADVVIADVPGIEIEISTEAAYVDSAGTMQAAFSQDVTVLRAIQRHDFAMRHDFSVAVMTQVAY